MIIPIDTKPLGMDFRIIQSEDQSEDCPKTLALAAWSKNFSIYNKTFYSSTLSSAQLYLARSQKEISNRFHHKAWNF